MAKKSYKSKGSKRRRTRVPRFGPYKKTYKYVKTPSHKFVRSFQKTITSEGTGELGELTVSIGDFPSYTEFFNLYQRFRINALHFTFIPMVNNIEVCKSVSNLIANEPSDQIVNVNFYLANYFESPDAMSSLDDMRQLKSFRTYGITKRINWYVKPSVSVPVYWNQDNQYMGTAPKWKQWILTDSVGDNIKHISLKYGFDPSVWLQTLNGSHDFVVGYTVQVKAYIECRGIK